MKRENTEVIFFQSIDVVYPFQCSILHESDYHIIFHVKKGSPEVITYCTLHV